MRWNWSRCSPSASARIALITSPWLQATQTASSAEPRVPVAHRGDRPRRHLGQRLAVREARRRRLRLHDLPERVLGEVLDRLAGPVAVAALAEPVVDCSTAVGSAVCAAAIACGGLDAALQRARHDRAQRQHREPLGDRARPASAPRSSRCTPGRPAGQHRAGHRGQPVPDQQQRRHATSSRSARRSTSSTISSTPSAIR